MLFTILNLPDIKGTAFFGGLERVPIINPPFADISPHSLLMPVPYVTKIKMIKSDFT